MVIGKAAKLVTSVIQKLRQRFSLDKIEGGDIAIILKWTHMRVLMTQVSATRRKHVKNGIAKSGIRSTGEEEIHTEVKDEEQTWW